MSDWRDFHPRRCSTSPVTHHPEVVGEEVTDAVQVSERSRGQGEALEPDSAVGLALILLHIFFYL
jgi:hypothetical protein